MVQIMTHTPVWVFILFVGLIGLGFMQSKTRTLTRSRVIMLPVIMVLLSFYGVYSLQVPTSNELVAWVVSLAVILGLIMRFSSRDGIVYAPEAQTFQIPGSFVPLGLILAIFLTKYVVGVMTAMGNDAVTTAEFALGFGLINGFFSALFLSRALLVLKAAKAD